MGKYISIKMCLYFTEVGGAHSTDTNRFSGQVRSSLPSRTPSMKIRIENSCLTQVALIPVSKVLAIANPHCPPDVVSSDPLVSISMKE